jgi:hypothetical protein
MRKEYYDTKKGRLKRIYDLQVQSSKKRGHSLPSYTKDEFIEFGLKSKEYNDLFDKWKSEGVSKDRKNVPSTDRLDDEKPYSFDNIRFVDFGTNHKIYQDKKRNGYIDKNWVYVFDEFGEKINEFCTVKLASEYFGIDRTQIYKSMKSRKITRSKMFFLPDEDLSECRLETGVIADIDGRKFFFSTRKEASDFTGVTVNHIDRILKGVRKSAKGIKFYDKIEEE